MFISPSNSDRLLQVGVLRNETKPENACVGLLGWWEFSLAILFPYFNSDKKLLIESSEELGHIMLYSPENSVCIEPQTTTVNAFQLSNMRKSGTGVKYLKKDENFTVSTKWIVDF